VIYSTCIAQAAAAYSVPQSAIVDIVSKHSAAGIGIGPMGIPSAWLPLLARVGFPADKVAADPCEGIAAGAWVMAYEDGSNRSSPGPGPAPAKVASGIAAPHNTEIGDVSPACVSSAAQQFRLPLALLTGVLATEGGEAGQIHWNANGSYDMGPAQINSIWLPKLATAGVTRAMVINDGCLNVAIGAWILSQAMAGADPNQPTQYWAHVGDYNSTTPFWNERYAKMVWNKIVEDAEH
jgi:hypothetical protein